MSELAGEIEEKCTCTCEYDSVTGDFYEDICDWCSSPSSGSTTWELQRNTIHDLMEAGREEVGVTKHIEIIRVLIRYVMSIPAFIRQNPKYAAAFLEMIATIRTFEIDDLEIPLERLEFFVIRHTDRYKD